VDLDMTMAYTPSIFWGMNFGTYGCVAGAGSTVNVGLVWANAPTGTNNEATRSPAILNSRCK